MNSTPPGNAWLEVKYDKELDILYVRFRLLLAFSHLFANIVKLRKC